MTESCLVSIIIPTYNRAHLISETLDSVLMQTHTNWECIILDDGSEDETITIVKAYTVKDTRFKYYKRPNNLRPGGNAARNYGFELSQGEFIQWFDDDDIMLPNYLSKRLEFIDDNVMFSIGTGYLVDKMLENHVYIELPNHSQNIFKDYVSLKAKILTPSVLFRKRFLKDEKLFDVELTRGQEMDFFSRLFFKIEPNQFRIVGEPLFLYRQHEKSRTASDLSYHETNKESQALIFIDNLERSIQRRDQDLVRMFYQQLLKLFILGLTYNHTKNSEYILEKLVDGLSNVSPRLAARLKALGKIMLLLRYPSYRMHKYLKKSKKLIKFKSVA